MISNITNFLTSNRFRLEYTSFVSQPFRMRANVTLLMRLIDNICSNIAKHGAPEKPVVLTVSAAEGYLVLEERNAILRKTVKTAAADSGYGLAICEDVMGAMGGSISHRTQGQSLLRDPSFPHPAPAGGVSDETKRTSPSCGGEVLLLTFKRFYSDQWMVM